MFALISFGCELGRLCGKAGEAPTVVVHSPLPMVLVQDWAAAQGAGGVNAPSWQGHQGAPAPPPVWQVQQGAAGAPMLPPGWNLQSNGTAGGTFYIAPDGSRHWQLPKQQPAPHVYVVAA